MIESITGSIVALNPATITIETTGGVGFLVNITLPTFTTLEGKSSVRLLIHENIREDAWTLYGFITEDEREMFRALIGVSGVGAGSARMILSAIPAADLRGVIASGDAKSLKSVKGIGAKTAERIIVDLRDKIKATPYTLIEKSQTTSPQFEEALEALVILGFQRQASQKALKKIYEVEPSISIEAAIKRAMSMM
jgi:Holliday junction DNA helicase RuvA